MIIVKQIENRRSIRKYQNRIVEKEKIMKILESARLAPSGSNTQPWNFIIVESEKTKKKFLWENIIFLGTLLIAFVVVLWVVRYLFF